MEWLLSPRLIEMNCEWRAEYIMSLKGGVNMSVTHFTVWLCSFLHYSNFTFPPLALTIIVYDWEIILK